MLNVVSEECFTAILTVRMKLYILGNILAGGEGSYNHFNGIIDELRIFDRELTKKEIQILFYGR